MSRYNDTKNASILGIIGNLFLLIIKGLIGFISNSQAMIADAVNSFGDIFSSIMTYVGNKISSKEADKDHNLGHGKAEYIYSFLISIVMLITAFLVIKHALNTFINHEEIYFSYLLVVVCLITIITKLLLYLYTKKINKKHHNLLIEANSKDHRNDCLITTLTLISAICGLNGLYYIDIIAAIIISLWISYTAIKIFKESYDVLMDKCMDDSTKKKVYQLVKQYEEVKRINHFNSTPVGYRYQISFTIFVDGNLTTFKSHEIADNIEKDIRKNIPEVYLTIIHVNPMKIENN